jgi:predicted site-specific integrase-resolvase
MLTPEKARRRFVTATGVPVAVQTFYTWLSRGLLKPQKIGARWYIREDELNRLIHSIVVEHKDIIL